MWQTESEKQTMNRLCVVANKYPNRFEPYILVFVQQFVWALADLGVECIVVCPLAFNIDPRYLLIPSVRTEFTEKHNKITIYTPKFIGFGQAHKIFGRSPAPLTTMLFSRSLARTLRKMPVKPDVMYGHFITPAGAAAAKAGRELGIPTFMAYGDATLDTIWELGIHRVRRELSSLAGVMAVSASSKKRLEDLQIMDAERIAVFPNGYRPERFYPRDRQEARKRFGFPPDAFIVGIVGSFDERKGVLRLQSAVDMLDGVLFACAGKGKCKPTSDKCIYKSPVNHEEIPIFMSALDVFVLPTLNEGCSNAIVEAMAVGLPIISSDRPFNSDILNASNALLIDPENTQAIRDAIAMLRDDFNLRAALSKKSVETAKSLILEDRTKRILSFMRERIELQVADRPNASENHPASLA